jgi:prepilin-type N-terminal cleavage/methylation domain-containing protein
LTTRSTRDILTISLVNADRSFIEGKILMEKWAGYLKFLRLFPHGEKGFTLIELLVVISILGSLGGIATVNLSGFIGSGQEEAKVTEGELVHTAATLYLVKGNKITESFTVGPESQGVLDSYLIGNLNYSWTIDVNGGVNPNEDVEIEPEPKPKPEPEPVPEPEPKPKPVKPVKPVKPDKTGKSL